MDLGEFLLARIAEREELARALADAPLLAECEAKRRLVEYCQHVSLGHAGEVTPDYDDGYIDAQEYALKHLALPYADHPDYQPEWALEVVG